MSLVFFLCFMLLRVLAHLYVNSVNVHISNLCKHKPMSKLASVASLVALVCDRLRMSFHFLSEVSMRI